jgi:hypothetical protein
MVKTVLYEILAKYGCFACFTCISKTILAYRAFHRFGQAKFPDDDLILGLSQFLILPPKMLLNSKSGQN